MADPLVRAGLARLEQGEERLRLVPSNPDAAAVEILGSGPFVVVWFGAEHFTDELMADVPEEDWQTELRRMLEATVARGLTFAIEPEPDSGYRQVFTFEHPDGSTIERGAIVGTGRREHEPYMRRFAPYA